METVELFQTSQLLRFHVVILQFLQARCAIRGWITSAVPLGGRDDVGNGYIHTLIESLIMSLYARGHGALRAAKRHFDVRLVAPLHPRGRNS